MDCSKRSGQTHKKAGHDCRQSRRTGRSEEIDAGLVGGNVLDRLEPDRDVLDDAGHDSHDAEAEPHRTRHGAHPDDTYRYGGVVS